MLPIRQRGIAAVLLPQSLPAGGRRHIAGIVPKSCPVEGVVFPGIFLSAPATVTEGQNSKPGGRKVTLSAEEEGSDARPFHEVDMPFHRRE
jgi:hypothetical protein